VHNACAGRSRSRQLSRSRSQRKCTVGFCSTRVIASCSAAAVSQDCRSLKVPSRCTVTAPIVVAVIRSKTYMQPPPYHRLAHGGGLKPLAGAAGVAGARKLDSCRLIATIDVGADVGSCAGRAWHASPARRSGPSHSSRGRNRGKALPDAPRDDHGLLPDGQPPAQARETT
jgi:hypothetical protein